MVALVNKPLQKAEFWQDWYINKMDAGHNQYITTSHGHNNEFVKRKENSDLQVQIFLTVEL